MFQLMLAQTITEEHLSKLRYPLLVSKKMNGVRVIKHRNVLYTRQGHTVENRFLQTRYKSLDNGFEGELIAGTTFAETSGIIRSAEALPRTYNLILFDNLADGDNHYNERMLPVRQYVYDYSGMLNVAFSTTHECYSVKSIMELYDKALQEPYPSGEGLILRDPYAFYRPGRSTLNQQALLKMKRSAVGLAEVVSKTPLVRGQKECRAVGSVLCVGKGFGKPFKIGTGFTEEQRVHLWKNLGVGDRIEFEYFELSDKGVPLHPRFKSVVNPKIKEKV